MAYLVLARKYRPQKFNEIVGQSHVSKVLQNAIKVNRIAHAYIFAGPRGTGKTTTARIFAKALNCKSLTSDEPCDKCDFCAEIKNGYSVDVLEIDGASNRGIDEIRALRENVKFAPANLKYKIYIIDEAHQITEAAFNALLKTLEEPPEHVIFMLATTEPQKIPDTILSRCQRFKFRPLSDVEIANNLKEIIKKEKFSVDENAAGLISRAANGSIRDSLSILDQIVSYSPDEAITKETVRELLGLTPLEVIETLFEFAAKNDSAALLKKILEISNEGFDFIQIARDLRDRLRNLVMINYLSDEKNIELHYLPEEMESLKRQKNIVGIETLMRGFHLMNKCLEEIRWSDTPRLVFELYALKFASGAPTVDELLKKVEELEGKLNEGGSNQEVTGRFNIQTASVQGTTARAAPTTRIFVPAPTVLPDSRSTDPSCPVSSASDENFEKLWASALEELRKRRPLISGFIETCQDKKILGNQIILSMGSGMGVDSINKNLYVIEPLFSKVFNKPVKILIETGNKAEKEDAVPMQKNQEPEMEAVDRELITTEEEMPPEVAKSIKVEMMPEKESQDENKKEVTDNVIKKIVTTFSGKIIKNGISQKSPAANKRTP